VVTGFGGDEPTRRASSLVSQAGRGAAVSAVTAITIFTPIASVGIEHRPPGLDPAWFRNWFLDAAAYPVRLCRLVPFFSAQHRARELQKHCGAESFWML
jgi:hypothetical protein